MLRPDDPDVTKILAHRHSGWLYAIVAPELNRVKIGWAKNVSKRLLEFQTGSPTELLLHSATLETNILLAEAKAHAPLAHARLRGEWFKLNDYAVDQWLATRETDTPANGLHDRYLEQVGHPFKGFLIVGGW
jgi:hypothetical protein